MNFYNEIEPFACDWLEALADAGEIPPGRIDRRSIEEISPHELAAFDHCHFFAGIGGWARALRLAGWPAARPVWTGSCPCQPFSTAGRKRALNDPRHLWPAWRRLIGECRPRVVFGEQVVSRDAAAWFDVVSADLGALGYAVAGLPFPAAGVGAPHPRERLYWLAVAPGIRREWKRAESEHALPRQAGPGRRASAPVFDPWERAEWIECADGLRRPIEPGVYPLAYGIPGRVGRLRGYGNAIVPQQAAAFIRAAVDVIEGN